jgi:hypothetical protein
MNEITTTRRAVWFYNLELALLTDGSYHLSMVATSVDEEEPQLVCQEVLDERAASIDDALAKLKRILAQST